jgi:hypothetical protein
VATKRGRPTKYTAKIADEICARLAEGESLNRICAADRMPQESTVRHWALEDREGFFAKYAQARLLQAQLMFDEMLVIADDGTNDTYVDGEGNERTDHDVIARSKLRIDTRKWWLARVAPKFFGDRISHELTGKDGGPIETREMSDEEVTKRLTDVRNRLVALPGAPSTNGRNGH